MSPTTTYHLRPVSAMTRSSSPTASTSTASDRSPPPLGLGAHHPPSKTMLPPSTTTFSPVPTNARPRRPLSPSSLRDVDIPLDPSRAFAARGKFPAPPTGHELMALFPPAPPLLAPGPTSGFFEREERAFFAQAGREIVRLRLEIDTAGMGGGGGASPVHSHHRAHQPQHQQQHHSSGHERGPSHGASPHGTSPRSHLPPTPSLAQHPPQNAFPLGSPQGPAHPGYPVSRPEHPSHLNSHGVGGPGVGGNGGRGENVGGRGEIGGRENERGNGGGGGEPMAVDDEADEDDAWRRPTPHNARRRAGKHTRRVIVK